MWEEVAEVQGWGRLIPVGESGDKKIEAQVTRPGVPWGCHVRACVQRLVGMGKRPEGKKARVLGSLWRSSGWDSELSLLSDWVEFLVRELKSLSHTHTLKSLSLSLSHTHTHTHTAKTPNQQMVKLIKLEGVAVFLRSPNVSAQLCLTLCNPMDCSLPASSVLGVSQVAISSSKGSFWLRDWTRVSCIGRRILYHWATCEAFFHLPVALSLPPFSLAQRLLPTQFVGFS